MTAKTVNKHDTSKSQPLDKDKILKLYWRQGLSQQETANQIGCSRNKLRYYMDKYNIKSRTQSPEPKITKEKLKELYIDKKMSGLEIADITNFSKSIIYKWLDSYNIDTRSHLGNLKSDNFFKKQVNKLVGQEYTFLDKYKGQNVKLKVRHNKCDFEYRVEPGHFLQGRRCPKCNNIFSGEERIKDFLEINNIKYEREYTFSDCYYKGKLRFDFAVFYNKRLYSLIEYDGSQHFKSVKYFGGERGFKKRKIRDNIKNNYCEQNEIKLIRIPFYKKNSLGKILSNKLDNKLLGGGN